jgi:hypothetical protein
MPLHLFYNVKSGFLALLLVALTAEYFLDYEPLFDVSMETREQPVLKSMGIIDQYIKQYNYAKYAHVIDDNIFSENVVVEQKSVKKVTPIFKPFTVQLEVRGIAITPQRKMVMIWDKQKSQSEILLENEKLYEWEVVSIEKHRVTLEHELGELYEFLVNDETLTNFNMQR